MENNSTNHQKAIDILAAMDKMNIPNAATDPNDDRLRIIRQRNILIKEYNKTIAGMDPIKLHPLPVKQAYEPFKSKKDYSGFLYNHLSVRAARAILDYFVYRTTITIPEISDLREIDFHKLGLMRGVGMETRKEIELFIQNLY